MEKNLLPPQRELFDIPEDICYLNCAYMGPLPRSAREAGIEAVARKSQPWNITPEDFFTDVEKFRGLAAALIDGDPDGVAVIPSVSYGMGVAAQNVQIPRGSTILLLQDQFPSNVYPWREAAVRTGAEIRTIPRPEDGNWTRAVENELDERTSVLAVPHCHWTDGSLLDLERLGERCRAVQAALVVDGTQSIGALPFSVKKIRPDFVVTAAYKWLLGPYSLGFLWAAPQHREGTPLEFSWLTRANSRDFTRLTNYCDTYREGARRYDVGETGNFVLLPMAIAALRQIADWGVERIQSRLRDLTRRVAEEGVDLGCRVVPEEHRSGHLLGLHWDRVPVHLTARLAERRIFVSVRNNSVRVSPHVYNTERDIDRFLSALREELAR